MLSRRGLERRVVHALVERRGPVGQACRRYWAPRIGRPIFVVGCARSGTTHLGSLLARHTDVAAWSEANDVWDPGWYPWRPELKGDRWPLEHDPDEFVRRWWDDAQPRGEAIAATFGGYRWLERRARFLNKSPYNTYRIGQVDSIFQHAQYVHIVRDGRAVAASYVRHLADKLGEWPDERVAAFESRPATLLSLLGQVWAEGLRRVDRARPDLGGRLVEISYEELCTSPLATLQTVMDHLGLDRRGLDPAAVPSASMPRNGAWRADWPVDVQQQLETQLLPWLTRYHYV